MTISTTNNKVEYSIDGETTEFTFSYTVYQSSDIACYLVDSDGNQTAYTDFTIVLNTDNAGGTVTTNTTLTTDDGVSLVIIRETQLTQGLDLIEGGKFPAESMEQALDKTMMVVQDQQESLDNALKKSSSNSQTIGVSVLTDAKVIGYDGEKIVSGSVDLTNVDSITARNTAISNAIAGLNGDVTQLKAIALQNNTTLSDVAYLANGVTLSGQHYLYDVANERTFYFAEAVSGVVTVNDDYADHTQTITISSTDYTIRERLVGVEQSILANTMFVKASWFGFDPDPTTADDDRFDEMVSWIGSGGEIFLDVDVMISASKTFTKPFKITGTGTLIGDTFTQGYTGSPSTLLTWEGSVNSQDSITVAATTGDTALTCVSDAEVGEIVIISNYPTTAEDRRKEIAIVLSNDGATVTLNSGLFFDYSDTTDFYLNRINWYDGIEISCNLKNIRTRMNYCSNIKYNVQNATGARGYHINSYGINVHFDEFDAYQSDCRMDFNDACRFIKASGWYHSMQSSDPNGFIKLNQAHDALVDIVADSNNYNVGGAAAWSVGLMIDEVFSGNGTGYDIIPSKNISGRVIANGTRFAVYCSSSTDVTERSGNIQLDVICKGGTEQLRLKNVDGVRANLSGGYPVFDGAKNCLVDWTESDYDDDSAVTAEFNNDPVNCIVRGPYSFIKDGSTLPFVFGLTTTGTGTYTYQLCYGQKENNKRTVSAHITWTAHDGAGNIRIKLPIDEDTINASKLLTVDVKSDLNSGDVASAVYDSGSNRFYLLDSSDAQVAIESAGTVYMEMVFFVA